MVYMAARAICCDPGTIYDRAKASPAVQQCIANEVGMVSDICEMKLYEQILAGNLGAIKFWLNANGRERGYGDKREVKGAVAATVPMSEELKSELTSALAEAVLALHEKAEETP